MAQAIDYESPPPKRRWPGETCNLLNYADRYERASIGIGVSCSSLRNTHSCTILKTEHADPYLDVGIKTSVIWSISHDFILHDAMILPNTKLTVSYMNMRTKIFICLQSLNYTSVNIYERNKAGIQYPLMINPKDVLFFSLRKGQRSLKSSTSGVHGLDEGSLGA